MSIETTVRVWGQSRASGEGLLMLLALADQADPSGLAFVNKPLLAERCRMSEAKVEQILRKLVSSGELLMSNRDNCVIILAGIDQTEAQAALKRWEER